MGIRIPEELRKEILKHIDRNEGESITSFLLSSAREKLERIKAGK
jgi:hypothetical protein